MIGFQNKIVILFLLGLLTFSPVCLADTVEIYINPNKVIQSAIDEAYFGGGGTVYLHAGEYENGDIIFLRESVSLVGIQDDIGSVVISGIPDTTVIWAESHTTLRNLVIYNGRIGIRCYRKEVKTTDVTILNNLVVGNEYGIYLRDCSDIEIVNNTIANNKKSGVYIYIDPNGPNIRCEANITAFNNPDCGIEFVQQDGPEEELSGFIDTTTLPISFRFNDFYDKAEHKWFDGNGYLRDNIPLPFFDPFGPGNFSADPFFINPNGFINPCEADYRLISYSPCIDKGDPNRVGFLYEPPPNGGRANIGFYGNTQYATQSLDSDKDGPLDYEEGLNDADGDEVFDYLDADTASIPIFDGKERISLIIRSVSPGPDEGLHLEDSRAISPSGLPVDPPQGIFPFGAFHFKVKDIDEGALILLKILLPKEYDALGISAYKVYSSSASWESVPYDLDPDNTVLFITIEEGQGGDSDGIRNGIIEHIGCLTIPRSISMENPGACFISSIPHHPGNERDITHLLLLFLPLCFVSLLTVLISHKSSLPFFIIFLLLPLLCPFLSSSGWAVIHYPEEYIRFSSSPHPVGSGARALGMGGAFIGVADDATAASWNPAGLKHLTMPEISLVDVYSSRREYAQERIDISGKSHWSGWGINYFSLACPGRLFKKNFVVSLNYQHLYDFSQKISSYKHSLLETHYQDMHYWINYERAGGINALSPALAVIVTPQLSLGVTLNMWLHNLFDNEWVENTHKDGCGVIGKVPQPVITHADFLERFKFSGFNLHFGILWDFSEFLTFGGVYKTPFKADLEHTFMFYRFEEYPKGPSRNRYKYGTQRESEHLAMPQSFGIGVAYHPLDQLVIDLDIYQTEWGEFELIEADGNRRSPVTGLSISEVPVKPTYQIRIGGEYAFVNQRSIIPALRWGIFYDPEPAHNRPDDFYGISLGLGLTLREKRGGDSLRRKRRARRDIMSIDMAYQYRWGRKRTADPDSYPLNIDHHLIYISIIYYI